MDFGFVTFYSEDTVKMAKRGGFDCLEVCVDKGTLIDLDENTDESLEKVLNIFKENNIKFGTLAGNVNHLEGNPEKRRENNEYFKKIIRSAKKFGTDIVISNAWANPDISPEENLKEFKKVFTEYTEVAENEGVRIALENCPHWIGYPTRVGNIAFSPEMWEAMFDAVPSKALGLEFDPSHLLWEGIDYIRALKEFGDKVFAFHAKDTEILMDQKYKYGIIGKQLGKSSEWDYGWWRYRIPGWGDVDWLSIFRVLNDLKYTGPMMIEHEDPVFGGERTEEGLRLGLRYLKQFVL